MKAQTEFIHWLRSAYAMEKARELVLARQRDDEKAPPLFRQQAARHLLDTQRHAAIVAACLHDLGASASSLRNTLARGVARMKNAARHTTGDRHISALLSACASEHFEIACFSALRTCAQRLGLSQFALTCGEIIREEKRMAAWLEQHLPKIVSACLDLREMEKSPAKKARQFIDFIHLRHRDY
ncbi:ferritin-like domain-containing protein [Prosthecobacter sp.]|uniref:ferritin-like domain-containing protein n=1 Tax=Prosthecobacter sp. TaxID=1965333 RepID=UPI0037835EB5